MAAIDPSEFKCPVCGSQNVEARNLIQESVLMTCKTCGTTDDARMFAPRHKLSPPSSRPAPPEEGERITAISEGEAMREYYPPDDVQEAARKVHEYFAKRGAKSWAFGELQSRNWSPPLSLTASKEDVQRLATAFGCSLIPSADLAKANDVLLEMEQWVTYLRANGGSKTEADNVYRFFGKLYPLLARVG